jgi:serine/threonine-protein kinase
VVLVDLAAALTYAAWRSARDGIAWRLPDELEWERAARGADGRFHPWGDRFDPTFCRNRLSYADGVRPSPAAVGAYPDDTSPFGVRDLAGNVRTWCTNVWGGETELQRTAPVVRGGSWSGHPQICRSATRTQTDARVRGEAIGVRLAADPGARGG